MIRFPRHCFGTLLLLFTLSPVYAQLPESALDHLLQRKKVTKTYEKKKFGDRLFLEGGGGLNVLSRSLDPAPQVEGALGDWVTPEHGWRLGLRSGMYRIDETKSKFASLTLDYLMNFNAIASPSYERPKRLEFYGLAGFDFTFSRRYSVNRYGWGAHLGLRGQYAFSPYTYIYMEPRVGFLSDDVGFSETWRGLHPTASLTAGLGYRLQQGSDRSREDGETTRRLRCGEGMFATVLGGGGFLLSGFPREWKHSVGSTMRLRFGKWFDTNNALQFGVHSEYLKQGEGLERVKSVGLNIDYVLNLHNVFGGYKANRRWWVNGMVGASLGISDSDKETDPYFGLGAGLQGHLGLAKGVSLVIEPRIDFCGDDFAESKTSIKKTDIVPSVLFGLNYTYLPSVYYSGRVADDFSTCSWHDNMFVEVAAGANLPIASDVFSTPSEAKHYVRPQLYVGLGKWFTPVNGLRVWSQAAETDYERDEYHSYIATGLDYLLNISNLVSGYHERRRGELIAGLGMNAAVRQNKSGAFFGMNASLKGVWHFNELFGLYLEPRVHAYGKRFMPYGFRRGKIDLVGSVNLGAQVNLKGYNRTSEMAEMDEKGARSYISFAGGLTNDGKHFHDKGYFAPVGRVSYTSYFTPVSAYRIALSASARHNRGEKYASALIGADYMADLTAYTLGYDPNRLVNLVGFLGFDVGTDYTRSHLRFLSDIHFGGQVGIKVGGKTRLFLEPQTAYCFSPRFENGSSRLQGWRPQVLLGIEQGFDRSRRMAEVESPEKKRFVSLDLGTGAYTGTVMPMSPAKRKFTFATRVAMGRWFNGVHGLEGAISHTDVQRSGKGNQNIISLRADYLMNLRAALTGEQTEDKLFRLTGILGAALNINKWKGHDTTYTPGMQAAIQAGFRVVPSFEIYLQPEGVLYAKKIEDPLSGHPIEGELRLSLGTKFYF